MCISSLEIKSGRKIPLPEDVSPMLYTGCKSKWLCEGLSKKLEHPLVSFYLKLCVFLFGGHPRIVLLAFWTLRCEMLTRAGEVLQQSKQDAAIPAVWAVGFTSGQTLSRTCCSHQQLHGFIASFFDTLAVFSPSTPLWTQYRYRFLLWGSFMVGPVFNSWGAHSLRYCLGTGLCATCLYQS